mmetsp:Transcript_2158/g.2471  ORF Transcript_2158/g.2471 Transcript_2158/m.2471 type:complete len:183 (-) Transcript_2158:20-568(-)
MLGTALVLLCGWTAWADCGESFVANTTLCGSSTTCVEVEWPAGNDTAYCLGVVTYPIAAFWNVSHQDAMARTAYETDRDLWIKGGGATNDINCETQQCSTQICNNCLAIRRTYHCARLFPRCLSAQDPCRGLCRSVCEDKNRRCNDNEGCGAFPKKQCAAGWHLAGPLGPLLTLWVLALLLS